MKKTTRVKPVRMNKRKKGSIKGRAYFAAIKPVLHKKTKRYGTIVISRFCIGVNFQNFWMIVFLTNIPFYYCRLYMLWGIVQIQIQKKFYSTDVEGMQIGKISL